MDDFEDTYTPYPWTAFRKAAAVEYPTYADGIIDRYTFYIEDIEETTVTIYKDRIVFDQMIHCERLERGYGNGMSVMQRPLGVTTRTFYYNRDQTIKLAIDTCTSDGRCPNLATDFIFVLKDEDGEVYNLNFEVYENADEAHIYSIYHTKCRYTPTYDLDKNTETTKQRINLDFVNREVVYYLVAYFLETLDVEIIDVFSSFFTGDEEKLPKLYEENMSRYVKLFRTKLIKDELMFKTQ